MMTTFALRPRIAAVALVASGALFARPGSLDAQVADSAAHGQMSGQSQQTARELQELQAQVDRLQAQLEEQRRAAPPPAMTGQPPAGGMRQKPMEGMDKKEMGGMGMREMGGMPGMDMMDMMDMHEGEMGMPPEGMEMPKGMMMDDMDEMGPMPSGSGMAPGGMSGAPAAASRPPARTKAPKSMTSLPGVPGGSHLYHIGSSGFFLDQPRIALTSEQQAALNKIKERALLERGKAERGIEQAEQELWVLTGADRPDAGKVEAKAREIERLRTNQRLAFIQVVGEATKLLTPEQRSRLLGTASTPAK
jgi:Spy/CpxP family protein refolding chaperone